MRVKNLVEFGYDVVVVTGPDTTSLAWAPRDPSLLGDVLATEVVRIPGPEPPFSVGWTGRKERWLRSPSPFQRWLHDGLIAAARARAGSFDVVVAQMSPWETAEAAAAIAAESGVPWIPELHDPWALGDWEVYPTRIHRRLEARRMRNVLASAAAIGVSVPELGVALQRSFPELRSKPVVPLQNGFTSEMFESIEAPRRNDGKFRIVHTGYLHVSSVREYERHRYIRKLLGGAVAGFDPSTRSHLFLFAALDSLLTRRPELADVIEVHLAGVLTDSHLEVPRAELIHAHGYLEHRQSVELLMSADLLFLPMHNFTADRRTREAPGKLYEYLASGKPVLAAIPPGDARDVLGEVGTGLICAPDDVGAMARIIEEQIDRWAAGEEPPQAAADLVAHYDRRNVTKRLAAVIDDVAATAARWAERRSTR